MSPSLDTPADPDEPIRETVLVQVTGVAYAPDQFLHRLPVPGFGGPDEIVVGDVEQLPGVQPGSDLGALLENKLWNGETVTVWYDPGNPADSVLNREIRWGLMGFKSIFFFVFGGVGLGLIIYSFRSPVEKDLDAPHYADAPWLANDAWQGGDVCSPIFGIKSFDIV